jgi:hypothetical protein
VALYCKTIWLIVWPPPPPLVAVSKENAELLGCEELFHVLSVLACNGIIIFIRHCCILHISMCQISNLIYLWLSFTFNFMHSSKGFLYYGNFNAATYYSMRELNDRQILNEIVLTYKISEISCENCSKNVEYVLIKHFGAKNNTALVLLF